MQSKPVGYQAQSQELPLTEATAAGQQERGCLPAGYEDFNSLTLWLSIVLLVEGLRFNLEQGFRNQSTKYLASIRPQYVGTGATSKAATTGLDTVLLASALVELRSLPLHAATGCAACQEDLGVRGG